MEGEELEPLGEGKIGGFVFKAKIKILGETVKLLAAEEGREVLFDSAATAKNLFDEPVVGCLL